MSDRFLRPIPNQARGFDCNTALDKKSARAFRDKGYAFAVRYVRRGAAHPFDLTTGEVAAILGAGLGLMAVQHVESAESWQPSGSKGDAYGGAAVSHAKELGFPSGSMIWCDLEGVAEGTDPDDVIAYLHGWFDVVSTAGYLPGLYVGFHAGLSADQLYHSLRFEHYWAAYNLNLDQYPATRGVQMRQWSKREEDTPNGITFSFDVDTVLADKLGGLPVMLEGGGPTPNADGEGAE